MKIHFCDLCNESVPQSDLDEGRAQQLKGRVVCAACERAMSHHVGNGGMSTSLLESVHRAVAMAKPLAPSPEARVSEVRASAPASAAPAGSETAELPPYVENEPMNEPVSASMPAADAVMPPPIAPAPAPMVQHTIAPMVHHRSATPWLAIFGILFAAGAVFVVDDRLQGLRSKQQDAAVEMAKVATRQESLERSVTGGMRNQQILEERWNARFDGQKAAFDSLAADLRRLSDEQNNVSRDLVRISADVKSLNDKSGGGAFELEKRMAELSSRIAKGEDERTALLEKIKTLEQTAATPAPVLAEAPQPAAPSWQVHLGDLRSPDESVRLEAVTTLGASKDPAVVPVLVPMLKDANVFVRMATARMLGDLAAKPAIEPLIDALEDPQSAVREAAYVALRTITGKDLKFDPQAIESERAKRVRAWRDWFKKADEEPGASRG